MEFRELTGLLGDGSCGGIGEFLGDRAAQMVRCGFEDFVCAEWLWFLCVGAHENKGGVMFCKTVRGAMSFLSGHREGLTTEDTEGTERIRLYGCGFYLALKAANSAPVILLIL